MAYKPSTKLDSVTLNKWVKTNKNNTKPLFQHEKVIINDYYNQYEDNQFGDNVIIRRSY